MKLETKAVEKVWGRKDLPEPFAAAGEEPVGEIWFDPPPELSQVLVKYLFTSEKLSVQVHPSDAEAPEGSRGKEECWLVLDAEPDAKLAIGFKEPMDSEAMRSAALDGSIEDALEWHPVEAGDFFYLPAGTVHAIGPGLTLVEVQQNSDITYRLFDYGRPRELHLEDGVKVARGQPYPAQCRRKIAEDQTATLVDGPFFRFSQVHGAPDKNLLAKHGGALLALPLQGTVAIDGEVIGAGDCGMAKDIAAIDFSRAERTLLVSGV
jgi:mannose-6-phosphate isomerase